MKTAKQIQIPIEKFHSAWRKVKSNAGAAGIDAESIEDFERKLDANLYKLWNRMSSGSYFPPPVRMVEIPKRAGGTRKLGIPTIGDRVCQTVVKEEIEPRLESLFAEDSYGYRPGRSCHDAIAVTRKRCWRYDWVLEYDIKGLFDNLSHELLRKAIQHQVKEKWIVLYIDRWLTAPLITEDGEKIERTRGTPQGGVVSPILSNLFLHFAIDLWMGREFKTIPWCRYADDGLMHCVSEKQAQFLQAKLASRLQECELELHPIKTRIVYCRDDRRRLSAEKTSFEFLGYDFTERAARASQTKNLFWGFSPGIGAKRLAELRHKVKHDISALKRTELSIHDLARVMNPIIRGWLNYYGRFYNSALDKLRGYINYRLMLWASTKFKSLKGSRKKAFSFLRRLCRANPKLFAHWDKGWVS